MTEVAYIKHTQNGHLLLRCSLLDFRVCEVLYSQEQARSKRLPINMYPLNLRRLMTTFGIKGRCKDNYF